MTSPPPRPPDDADLDPLAAPSIAAPADEASAPPPRRAPRRLTRSRTDNWIGGVAGGLGEYWDTDPTLIRIGLVGLAVISGGLAIPAYIIAWIAIPEAPGYSADAGDGGGDWERRPGLGGVIWGMLLALAGAAVLLAQLDISLPRWDVTLAVALIVVGAIVVIEARRRVQGGLILLAVIITAMLAFGQIGDFDLNVESGFGDRMERVEEIGQLESSYSHAFGSMTVDLRQLDLPEGTTRLDVDIAFGSVAVRLPRDVPYRIDADGAFSSVDAAELSAGGLALNRSYTSPGYAEASSKLDVSLSVVFGSAEVD